MVCKTIFEIVYLSRNPRNIDVLNFREVNSSDGFEMHTVLMARSDLHCREFSENECVICFGINIDRQQVVSVIFHVGTC